MIVPNGSLSGFYRALVVSAADPATQGRVKVRIPDIMVDKGWGLEYGAKTVYGLDQQTTGLVVEIYMIQRELDAVIQMHGIKAHVCLHQKDLMYLYSLRKVIQVILSILLLQIMVKQKYCLKIELDHNGGINGLLLKQERVELL